MTLKVLFFWSLVVPIILAGQFPSTAQAQILREVVKQAGKALGREAVEAGAKSTARQALKQLGKEAAEAATKRTASTLAKGGLVDDVANAISRNSGTIIGGVALGTAVANSDQLIAAGSDVMKTGITTTTNSVVQPIAQKAADGLYVVFCIFGVGCLGGLAFVAWRRWPVIHK